MSTGIAIFGMSGFAREVADIVRACGIGTIRFILRDDESAPPGTAATPESEVASLAAAGYRFAIGIGEPRLRRAIARRHPDLPWAQLVHPCASFGDEAILRDVPGLIVAAGVRMTNGIRLGPHSLFNLNATVGHDCEIGACAAVMPGVNVSGNVRLGEGAYIGTGASILHGGNEGKLEIGDWAVVGAGAVVTRPVAAGATVVGVPAREIGERKAPPA